MDTNENIVNTMAHEPMKQQPLVIFSLLPSLFIILETKETGIEIFFPHSEQI